MKKKYADYCTNYDSAETLYKQKIKKKEFEAFLNASTILKIHVSYFQHVLFNKYVYMHVYL